MDWRAVHDDPHAVELSVNGSHKTSKMDRRF